MITSMLAYETIMWAFIAHFYDSMPIWLRTVLLIAWFVIHLIAYASEDNLRDKVKSLEDEVAKLKKGGAE